MYCRCMRLEGAAVGESLSAAAPVGRACREIIGLTRELIAVPAATGVELAQALVLLD